MALSIFNSTTKRFSVPLLSVTTSAVAAAGPLHAKDSGITGVDSKGSRQLGGISVDLTDKVSEAASSSLLIALAIGLLQVTDWAAEGGLPIDVCLQKRGCLRLN